jgi:hypothetical protein
MGETCATKEQRKMNDPSILFVKPKAISAADKRTLKNVGVIVVEVDDPSAVKFVRAGYEIETTAILRAAVKAVRSNSTSIDAFGRAMCAVLDAADASDKPKDGAEKS